MGESKHSTHWKVLRAAIELDSSKGHLLWTMSDLSRKSGVTRSLIYYYFGRQKKDILLEAVRFIGKELFGLSDERLELWKNNQIDQSVTASRKLFQKYHFLYAFYFCQRAKDSLIGKEIRNLEAKHLNKIKSRFPDFSTEECQVVSSLFLGFVLSPEISPHAIQMAVQRLHRNHSLKRHESFPRNLPANQLLHELHVQE